MSEKKRKNEETVDEHIKYKAYAFKLNDKTVETLREMKQQSGLSWNLFFYNNLIKKDGDKRRK